MNLERASISVSGADSEVRLEYCTSLSDTKLDPGIIYSLLERDFKEVPCTDNFETYPYLYKEQVENQIEAV